MATNRFLAAAQALSWIASSQSHVQNYTAERDVAGAWN
jgi:hypothetical protein